MSIDAPRLHTVVLSKLQGSIGPISSPGKLLLSHIIREVLIRIAIFSQEELSKHTGDSLARFALGQLSRVPTWMYGWLPERILRYFHGPALNFARKAADTILVVVRALDPEDLLNEAYTFLIADLDPPEKKVVAGKVALSE